MAQNGMVAATHPLASLAGLDVLREGGNAVDAAIAMIAVLGVVEPHCSGPGGDLFLILYEARSGEVRGLNASGRSPLNIDADVLRRNGRDEMPKEGGLSVTVPGAVDGWVTALDAYGSMDLGTLLAPAIGYAEKGFPVSPTVSAQWALQEEKLLRHPSTARIYLPGGRPPRTGEMFFQSDLARTLRLIAEGKGEAFYRGEIAKDLVQCVEENGGCLSPDDFEQHSSTWVQPLSTEYRGHRVLELPPNGQGITTLLSLNILSGFEISELKPHEAPYWHLLLESFKLAFADRNAYLGDPGGQEIPIEQMLSPAHAESQRTRIDLRRASEEISAVPLPQGNTTYLATADSQGNMVSLIASLFAFFGSGLTGEKTGIALHNRASGFNLQPGHPNCLAPAKRPLHTIIPSFVFRAGRPSLAFGVTGAELQPQAHVQVLLNLIDHGMDVQAALDAPRIRYRGGDPTWLEDRHPSSVLDGLRALGHEVETEGFLGFGGGQGIQVDPETGVYVGGSDSRRDGCALGY
ncbi:MAG: gamma-glutamyltransferase [bacterium]